MARVQANASVTVGDHWFVTNGVVAVGPVDFDLLTRGVAQGRIPNSSFVRHETWKVWRRLEDIEGLSVHARQQKVEELGGISMSAAEKASNPHNEPPPPPPMHDLFDETAHDEPPSSVRPVTVDPVGVLAKAADYDDALLLALSTAVTAAQAEVGLVHRVQPDWGVTYTACAHGPGAEALLGEKLSPEDPSLAAAQASTTLLVEPRPGEVGRFVAGRIARCLSGARGAAMVPLTHRWKLAAMFEIGRSTRPFRAREVARVEDVVQALEERVVVMGWLE